MSEKTANELADDILVGNSDVGSIHMVITAARKEGRQESEKVLSDIERLLTNLQPHIPQACYPGHEVFIDNYVDQALDIIRAALASYPHNTPATSGK
jgi:hypothetical protein